MENVAKAALHINEMEAIEIHRFHVAALNCEGKLNIEDIASQVET